MMAATMPTGQAGGSLTSGPVPNPAMVTGEAFASLMPGTTLAPAAPAVAVGRGAGVPASVRPPLSAMEAIDAALPATATVDAADADPGPLLTLLTGSPPAIGTTAAPRPSATAGDAEPRALLPVDAALPAIASPIEALSAQRQTQGEAATILSRLRSSAASIAAPGAPAGIDMAETGPSIDKGAPPVGRPAPPDAVATPSVIAAQTPLISLRSLSEAATFVAPRTAPPGVGRAREGASFSTHDGDSREGRRDVDVTQFTADAAAIAVLPDQGVASPPAAAELVPATVMFPTTVSAPVADSAPEAIAAPPVARPVAAPLAQVAVPVSPPDAGEPSSDRTRFETASADAGPARPQSAPTGGAVPDQVPVSPRPASSNGAGDASASSTVAVAIAFPTNVPVARDMTSPVISDRPASAAEDREDALPGEDQAAPVTAARIFDKTIVGQVGTPDVSRPGNTGPGYVKLAAASRPEPGPARPAQVPPPTVVTAVTGAEPAVGAVLTTASAPATEGPHAAPPIAEDAAIVAEAMPGDPVSAGTAPATVDPRPARLAADTPLDLNSRRWIAQLADHVADMIGRDGTARVALAPERLGPLLIELADTAEGLSLRLEVATEAAQDALQRAETRLLADVRAAGGRIVDSQVVLASDGGAATGQSLAGGQQGGHRAAPHMADAPAAARTDRAETRTDDAPDPAATAARYA